MVEQTLIAKITTWLATLLPAIAGSIISLKLAKDNSSYPNRLFSFFCGVLIAHYLGWGLVEYFMIDKQSMLSSSIIFCIGIFGVTSVTEISNQAPLIIKLTVEKFTNIIK